jgi:hypothetical protein
MGIWSRDIAENLWVEPLPALPLTAPDAEGTLLEACQGHVLCIIDSFRAACPKIDENDSEAREPLDMMNRVSERTGCVFLVIHHAKKPQTDGKATGGARMSIRGSGALYDACASVFVFDGAKDEPTRIIHEKARITGKPREDMLMSLIDNEDGSLSFELSSTPTKPSGKGTVYEQLSQVILDFVAANPGCSRATLRASLGKKNTHISDTVHALLEKRLLVNFGSDKSGAKMALHVVQPDVF